MRLAGFAGCRVASAGSIEVPGAVVHEHPAHKTINVKATITCKASSCGWRVTPVRKMRDRCQSERTEKSLLSSAGKTEYLAKKNRKLKKWARTVDPIIHFPHIALFSFHL